MKFLRPANILGVILVLIGVGLSQATIFEVFNTDADRSPESSFSSKAIILLLMIMPIVLFLFFGIGLLKRKLELDIKWASGFLGLAAVGLIRSTLEEWIPMNDSGMIQSELILLASILVLILLYVFLAGYILRSEGFELKKYRHLIGKKTSALLAVSIWILLMAVLEGESSESVTWIDDIRFLGPLIAAVIFYFIAVRWLSRGKPKLEPVRDDSDKALFNLEYPTGSEEDDAAKIEE